VNDHESAETKLGTKQLFKKVKTWE